LSSFGRAGGTERRRGAPPPKAYFSLISCVSGNVPGHRHDIGGPPLAQALPPGRTAAGVPPRRNGPGDGAKRNFRPNRMAVNKRWISIHRRRLPNPAAQVLGMPAGFGITAPCSVLRCNHGPAKVSGRGTGEAGIAASEEWRVIMSMLVVPEAIHGPAPLGRRRPSAARLPVLGGRRRIITPPCHQGLPQRSSIEPPTAGKVGGGDGNPARAFGCPPRHKKERPAAPRPGRRVARAPENAPRSAPLRPGTQYDQPDHRERRHGPSPSEMPNKPISPANPANRSVPHEQPKPGAMAAAQARRNHEPA